MSEDETLTGPEEDSALAAELAMRLLDGATRGKAEARQREDRDFADQVERWQDRLAPLFDQIEPVAAPASVWTAVATSLGGAVPANDNLTAMERRLRVWRGMTAGAVALAAACVAALVLRSPMPAPIPLTTPVATPSPLSIASLKGDKGPAAMIAAYNPGSRTLVVTPASLPALGKRSAELWLIPAGGKPQSLGLLDPSKPTRLAVPAGVGAPGAALAVSLEPSGGSPTGQPTGPVIASGALAVA